MSRLNFLLIGVDQMRADTPGFAGNPVCRTPNLDALAAESVVFDGAYAPSSQCSPSRASMLTGRHAFDHGMGNNCDMYHSLAAELRHPEQMLTSKLAAAGHRLGWIGKWHVGTKLGPGDYGFEGMSLPGYGDPKTEDGFRRYLKDHDLAYGPVRETIYGNHDATLLGGIWNGTVESTPTRYLTERVCDLLDDFARADEPFFLSCQYWAPHPPYLPSPEFAGIHERSAIPPWSNAFDDLAGKPSGLARFRRDFYRTLPDTWSAWQELVGLAYDYTAMVDAEVGRLVGHLDRLGLAGNTVVAFTSDHGDMLGSHGLFDKGFMYEEAHRVPLIVRYLGHLTPRRRNELVSNMDLLPTILDLAGISVGGLHARSLVPLLNDESKADAREDILLESHGMRHLYSQRAIVTADGWKYIFNPSHEDEAYDLTCDPGELVNLFGDADHAARIADLRARLLDSCRAARDPLAEYVAKLFGDWSNLSGQPDASAAFEGSEGTPT